MIAVTLGEWKRKLEFPTGETVILHNPKVKCACALPVYQAEQLSSVPASHVYVARSYRALVEV